MLPQQEGFSARRALADADGSLFFKRPEVTSVQFYGDILDRDRGKL